MSPRHIETISALHDLSLSLGGIVDLVVCSHFERFEVNLQNLFTQVEQSGLKVKYVLVIDRRCDEGGKHHSLRTLITGMLFI